MRDQWVTQARELHQAKFGEGAGLAVRSASMSAGAIVDRHARSTRVPTSSLLLIAILTLVWGCNWPVLKLGVTELPR